MSCPTALTDFHLHQGHVFCLPAIKTAADVEVEGDILDKSEIWVVAKLVGVAVHTEWVVVVSD